MFNFASVPVAVLWLDEAAKEESWCGGGFWRLRGGIRRGVLVLLVERLPFSKNRGQAISLDVSLDAPRLGLLYLLSRMTKRQLHPSSFSPCGSLTFFHLLE